MHHTLLKRRERTGVTVQTLHPKHFDQGTILAQTPSPGIPVPGAETCTVDQLVQLLAPIGGNLLVETIQKGLLFPPLDPVGPFARLHDNDGLHHAHKITPNDRRIDWRTWSASEIFLRHRVLGKLWDDEVYERCSSALFPGGNKRVNYLGWRLPDPTVTVETRDKSPGTPCLFYDPPPKPCLGISTCDGKIVCPTSATIEGRPLGEGLTELERIFNKSQQNLSDRRVFTKRQ